MTAEDRPTFFEIKKYFTQYKKQIQDKAECEAEERSLLQTRREAINRMQHSEQEPEHIFVTLNSSISGGHLEHVPLPISVSTMPKRPKRLQKSESRPEISPPQDLRHLLRVTKIGNEMLRFSCMFPVLLPFK